MTPMIGESIPNAETQSMAGMIRQNTPLCRDISGMIGSKVPRERIAALLRDRAMEALRPFLCEVDAFTRAALMTALRRTVDWEAVISLVLVDPEAN